MQVKDNTLVEWKGIDGRTWSLTKICFRSLGLIPSRRSRVGRGTAEMAN
jgi:hypothetical protein